MFHQEKNLFWIKFQGSFTWSCLVGFWLTVNDHRMLMILLRVLVLGTRQLCALVSRFQVRYLATGHSSDVFFFLFQVMIFLYLKWRM